jgi:hypothetical protein
LSPAPLQGIGAVYADRLVRAAPPELRSEHNLVVAKGEVLDRSIAMAALPAVPGRSLASAVADGIIAQLGHGVEAGKDRS